MRERGERPGNPVPPASEPSPVKPPPPLPIDWMKLDGMERFETLQVLFDWAPRFAESYEISEQILVRCWYQHEAMIHEVLALFQYRNQQQFNPDLGSPASAPIDFQYQLTMWKQRMRALTDQAGCKPNEHMDQRKAAWVDREKTDSASWRVFADNFAQELAEEMEIDE